jgi:hypothetical protein
MARTRYRWDGLQLVRLLCGRKAIENHARETFLWTFQVQKGFERVELLRLLKKALHLRSIGSFDLPGPNRFPLHLDLRWCSSFSTKGVAIVRKSPAKDRWDAMVAALELAEPTLYRKGSFGRDWMDSSRVRSAIDENPIQSHLQSIYPLARRSTLERKQVVATYLRVKKFLDLMKQWEQGNQGQLRESLDLGWELPIFYWFHLLCPSNQRESVLILTGDLDRVWGEPGVIDN